MAIETDLKNVEMAKEHRLLSNSSQSKSSSNLMFNKMKLNLELNSVKNGQCVSKLGPNFANGGLQLGISSSGYSKVQSN